VGGGVFKNKQNMYRGAQFVSLQMYFSHPSLVIYFSQTTPIKKTEPAKGERLLIETHPCGPQ